MKKTAAVAHPPPIILNPQFYPEFEAMLLTYKSGAMIK